MNTKGERSRDKLKFAAEDLARAVLRDLSLPVDLIEKADTVLRLVIAKQGQRNTLTIQQRHELAVIMTSAISRSKTQEEAAELARSEKNYFIRLTARRLITIYKNELQKTKWSTKPPEGVAPIFIEGKE